MHPIWSSHYAYPPLYNKHINKKTSKVQNLFKINIWLFYLNYVEANGNKQTIQLLLSSLPLVLHMNKITFCMLEIYTYL